jgi:hypothetical protein
MWTYNNLLTKSKLYFLKALDHEQPDSSEVPLWSFIGLELLGWATLSKISPALLADPNEGTHLLYALGFPSKTAPKSIPVKTVFHRCMTVVPEFTQKEYDLCMSWMNFRNEELHTGSLHLESLDSSTWMPELFRIVGILLNSNGETLQKFVGNAHLPMIEKMINSLSADITKDLHKKIAQAKTKFNALPVEVRLEKIKQSAGLRDKDWQNKTRGQDIKCPACEGNARILGHLVRSTTPKDEYGELIQDDVLLPVKLHCYSCTLNLDGYEYLRVLGHGATFTKRDYLNPKEYYNIEDSYPEPEYGND